jgi:hypothetical protein
MGTATSSATFFRSLGSSFGGAIFGAILISRLTKHLSELAPNAAGQAKISAGSIEKGGNLHALPPAVAHNVSEAFVRSFHDMFLLAVPVALLAFVVALFLRETPLRASHQEPTLEEL